MTTELSSSDESFSFRFLREDVTLQTMRSKSENFLNSDLHSAPIEDLSSVPSAHDGNRYDYLENNIVERLFPNNEEFRTEYFQSGE